MPGDTVFGAEQCHKLHTRSVRQKFDRGAALKILASVVGDQPDVFAAQRRKFFSLQHVQTSLTRDRHSVSANSSASVHRKREEPR